MSAETLRLNVDGRPAEQGAKRAESALAAMGAAARKATKDVEGAEDGLKRLGKAADQMKSVGRALTVGLSLPLAGIAAVSVRAAADMDSLSRGLRTVMGSASAAAAEVKQLQQVARLPGLGFREAIEGSINLQAAGFSAETARRALMGFGNALATVGKGKAELDGITLALTQMANSPRVLQEEINQIRERLPQFTKLMIGAFGTARAEEIQKLGLSGREFVERMLVELEKLPRATGGAANALEYLSDAAFRARAAIGKALLPAVLPLVEGLADMMEQMEGLNPAALQTAIAFGAVVTVVGPLTIGLSSLATAVVALSTAAAPLVAIFATGGALVVGLGALVGLWTKGKLEALAAAGAVREYTASLSGMNKEQLLAQRTALLGQKSRIAEMIGNLSGGKGNAGRLAQLRKQGMDVVGALAEVDRNLRALETGSGRNPIDTSLTDPLTRAAAAAKNLWAALGRLPTGLPVGPLAGVSKGATRPPLPGMVGMAGVSAGHFPGQGSVTSKAAPGFLAQLGGQVKGQIAAFVAQFGPLAAVAAALRPVFQGLMDTLGPVLQTLAEPLRVVGQLIGSVIAPVLKLLAPPLRLLAKGVSYVVEAFGWLIEALGKFVDKLIPDWLSKAGKGLAKMGEELQQGAREARRGLDATTDGVDALGEAASKTAAALLNVPRVLRLAQIRGQVSAGIIGGSSLRNPSPTDLGGSLPRGGGTTIVIQRADFHGVQNVEQLAEAVGKYASGRRVRGGTTRLAVAI